MTMEKNTSARSRQIFGKCIIIFLLVVFCAFMIIPIMWMITTTFRTPIESFSLPPQLIPRKFDLENYRYVFKMVNMLAFLKNSIIVSVCATCLQLITSSMSAFSFARLNFKGRNILFFAFLGALMIPGQVLSIPRFLIISKLGWINKLIALIIPSGFSAMAIFLIRQYMLTIPKSFDEAAYIDGATRLQCYGRIIVPMTKPVMMVMAMQTFVATWNDFYGPLIYINDRAKMTLPLGLVALNGVMGTGNQASIIAGVVLTFIPPLFMYVFGQRYLIKGITIGGIK